MSNENRVLLNHIRRLQDRNRELSEALADERILRKLAWKTYWKRVNSLFWGPIQMMADLYSKEEAARRQFEQDCRWSR